MNERTNNVVCYYSRKLLYPCIIALSNVSTKMKNMNNTIIFQFSETRSFLYISNNNIDTIFISDSHLLT